MQEIRTDEELPVLSAKNERLRVSGYRCCMSNQTTMFCHVGKITSSGEECPPSFPVTVSEVVAVKEQMCQVIGRINTQVPSGDNEGEELRNGRFSLSEAEKHVIPVNRQCCYALFHFKREEGSGLAGVMTYLNLMPETGGLFRKML